MFFFGTSIHNLDEKSRLNIPSRFKDQLGKRVFITKGFDHSLALYPEEVFMNMVMKNSSLDELSPEERQYRRVFFGSSLDYEIDKAGRITLSKDHLARAGISKEVVLVGNADHIEIWDKETYDKQFAEQDDNFELNAQTISKNRRAL